MAAVLADLFNHLNKFNLSLQGKQANFLLSTDKINFFNDKLGMWKRRIKDKNLNMFPLVSKTKLEDNLQNYFTSLSINEYD